MAELYGLVTVSDQYFADFPSINHMSNKHENRPYYLAVRNDNGIVWLVPISSKVEKYAEKIKKDEEKYGNCLYYYISRIKGEDRVFLIGNLVPVKEGYIVKPFTVNGDPFVVQDKQDIKQIQTRVARYLALVRQGKLRPFVNIMEIEKKLIEAP